MKRNNERFVLGFKDNVVCGIDGKFAPIQTLSKDEAKRMAKDLGYWMMKKPILFKLVPVE